VVYRSLLLRLRCLCCTGRRPWSSRDASATPLSFRLCGVVGVFVWCFVCACSLHRSLLLRALAFAAFRRPLIVCTVDYSAALLAVRACETRSLAAAFAIKLCRFGGSSAAPRSRAPWLRPFFFSLFLACALRRVTRRLDNPGARAPHLSVAVSHYRRLRRLAPRSVVFPLSLRSAPLRRFLDRVLGSPIC